VGRVQVVGVVLLPLLRALHERECLSLKNGQLLRLEKAPQNEDALFAEALYIRVDHFVGGVQQGQPYPVGDASGGGVWVRRSALTFGLFPPRQPRR
jgi:hypothetical protein